MSALTDATNTINQENEVVEKTAVEAVKTEAVQENATNNSEDVVKSTENDKEETAAVEKPVESTDETAVEKPVESTDEVAVEKPVESTDEVAVENSTGEDRVTDTKEVSAAVSEEVATETTCETVADEETTQDALAEAATTEDVAELSPEEKKQKLAEHLVSGRRFMKTSVFDKATEALSVAASLSAELFGEGHENTFDSFFLYGQALLELAKVEDQVLTNALTDMPKTSEEGEEEQDDVVENPENVPQEERAEIKQKVEEALGVAEETDSKEKDGAEVATSEVDNAKKSEEAVNDAEQDVAMEGAEEAEQEVVMEEETEEAEQKDVEMEDAEVQEAPEGSDGEAEEDDESMKLAWEILEASRCICEKKIASLESEEAVDSESVKVWKLKQADVLSFLGEHGVADSKYEQAQKDLTAAIEIQTVHLPATSRLLANTNHLLAKAFSSDSLFEKAATHFKEAQNILVARVSELKKETETTTGDAKTELESEIKELEEIIPELEAFVVDAQASEEQTRKLKETAKKELEGVAAAICKLGDGEATDITSMVRRPTKRPASEEQVDEVKKRKSEEGVSTVPSETKAETGEESESAPAPVSQ